MTRPYASGRGGIWSIPLPMNPKVPVSRTAAWATVLGWCALTGWFAFARGTRVPMLSRVDLGFHELGHLVMYILTIHEVLTAAMGSIFQCAIPLGIGAYFWFVRRDALG